MDSGALVGRAVAIGVGDGAGVTRDGGASDGGTGVGDGDLFGDGVGDTLVFFLAEALGEAFFVFLDGVGVFFAAGFFFFDVFAFGVGDLAGVAELSAAL